MFEYNLIEFYNDTVTGKRFETLDEAIPHFAKRLSWLCAGAFDTLLLLHNSTPMFEMSFEQTRNLEYLVVETDLSNVVRFKLIWEGEIRSADIYLETIDKSRYNKISIYDLHTGKLYKEYTK